MLHKFTQETQKRNVRQIYFTNGKQMLQCKNKGLQTNFFDKSFGPTSKIGNLK